MAEPESATLTIAVATVAENRQRLVKNILDQERLTPSEIKFTIISQKEEANKTYKIKNNITLITCTDKGLSKSRNKAITTCDTDWIWFQDDDIELKNNALTDLLTFLRLFKGNLVIGRVASHDSASGLFKNYKKFRVPKHLLSLKISSIEIIAKTSFIRSNELYFDENIGLGTAMPSGEENLFLHQALTASNAYFTHYKETICYHTVDCSNRNIDFQSRYIARGYLCRRIGFPLGYFLMLWWALRNKNGSLSIRDRASLLKQGFSEPPKC